MSSTKTSSNTDSHTSISWNKIFTPNNRWEDKEEFLDVIYWGRQFFAIIIGIAWGYLGWTGFFGLASFAAVNSLIVYIYAVNYNEDTDDEMMDFLKEGFMTALSCFMVSWILTYSAVFHGEKFSDSVIFPSS